MKNGFTLIELLLVIAIIGILAVIVIPNYFDVFFKGLDKSMEVVESNVVDAALLFESDYCLYSIDNNICPSTYKSNKYICLNDLINNNYIDSVKYNKEDCNGFVLFNKSNTKAYLYCSSYVTDDTVANKCH